MRTRTILAGLVLVLAAGCQRDATIKGTVVVHEETTAEGFHENVATVGDGGCVGTSGYDDLKPGAGVVVTDQGGKVIASGQLDAGHLDGRDCVLPFRVEGVPRTDFYRIEVTHRGQLTYTRKQLEAMHFTVGLEIGR